MHFKGFFSLSWTQLHSERPKLHTILAFLSAIGLKEKQIVLSKGIKILFLQYFLMFLTTKSRYIYMHSQKKSFQKKKVSNLPTLFFFFQVVTWTTHFFLFGQAVMAAEAALTA